MFDIDNKYIISAIDPFSGNHHTHEDAVLFLANDKAFLEGALPAYREKCVELGCSPEQIKSVDELITRVKIYQNEVGSKIPDSELVE